MVIQLTSLFDDSTSLLLAYTVPLLLLSALLTLSGAFLTLDRTRSFAPRSDGTPSFPGAFDKTKTTRKWAFRLEGGVGGLAIGYVFGLHAATFLSLLIMNKTEARPLSPTAFFVTWLFSILPSIVLGGRWKIAALTFLGISGGITLSLALSIITHPSLTSRVILASIFTPLTTLVVVVPTLIPALRQSNISHSTARVASSCLGAFSVTMAIALLTRSSLSYSWANAWERLWIANGPGWGTARERGFDALFCVLWAGGALTDWALKRWIGEDPEEKWDAYLAEYSATLPNAHDRAGRFSPLQSWWTRLLRKLHLTSSSPARPHDIIFPTDSDFSNKMAYAPISGTSVDAKPLDQLCREDLQRSVSLEAYNWDSSMTAEVPGVLKKEKTRRGNGFKRGLKAGNTSDADSDGTLFDLSRRPTFLQKAKNVKTKHRFHRLAENKRRAPVEFRPNEGFSSESDTDNSSDDDHLKTPSGTPRGDVHVRGSPLVRMNSRATSLSGTTVHPPSSPGHGTEVGKLVDELDVESEKARLTSMKAAFGGNARVTSPTRSAPEYSDVEEDVDAAYNRTSDRARYDTPGWKPGFLQHAGSQGNARPVARARSPATSTSMPPAGAVPMTPSLVHALGRIAKAQADAYGPYFNKGGPPEALSQDSPAPRPEHITIAVDQRDVISGLPVAEGDQQISGDKKVKWDTFWNEIQAKAAEH